MLKTATISFEVVGDNDQEGDIIYSTVLIEWYGATYTTILDKNVKSGMVTLEHVEEDLTMLDYTLLLKEVEANQNGLNTIIK